MCWYIQHPSSTQQNTLRSQRSQDMIKLADQPPVSKAVQFRCCCPNCRRVLLIKTHGAHKDVVCPTCQRKFTAYNKPFVTIQKEDAPAPKTNRKHRLIILFLLALSGALAFAVYWHLRPRETPAPLAEQRPRNEAKANTEAESVLPETNPEMALTPELDTYPDVGADETSSASVTPDLPNLPVDWLKNLDAAQEPITDLLPPVEKPEPQPVPQPALEPAPKPAPDPAPKLPPTTIQPFGGLTWDDDLLTTFQKTLALTESKSVTVAGIRCTDEQSMLGALRRLRADPVLAIQKPVVRCGSLILTGSPVIIGQGAFQIELEFISEPGYVLDHADECLAQAQQVFGPEADSYFPLRLRRVELTLRENTESRTLDGDTKVKIALQIYQQLKTKYADKKHFTPKDEPWTTTWQDLFKHKLRVYGSPRGASLLYESDLSYFSDLNQKLLKLQDEIKEKEHTGRFAKSEDRSDKL